MPQQNDTRVVDLHTTRLYNSPTTPVDEELGEDTPLTETESAALSEISQKQELRSLREIIGDFKKPIDSRLLRTKVVSGQSLTYISWFTAVNILDKYAAGWSYEVRSVQQVGDRIVVVTRITIPTSDGEIWREATGSAPVAVRGYGDASSNAESMSLRRAAAKFGLALYLYAK